MQVISRAAALKQKLKWYFTAQPCKHGHIAQRLVSDRRCRECSCANNRAWYIENRERHNEYSRAYYERIKEQTQNKRLERREAQSGG